MIGRWRPGQRSGSRDGPGVGPETALGAQLERLGRCRPDGQLPLTVEGDHRAIEPDMDLDPTAARYDTARVGLVAEPLALTKSLSNDIAR